MKKFGKAMGWIFLVIVFIIGLLLIFNEPIKSYLVQRNAEAKMQNLTRDQIKQNELKDGQFDFSKVKSISVNQVVKTSMQNDANPLGKLAVPAVGLKLPIVKGLSDTALSTGGGTMKPDQVMGKGNYALAGHYMTNKGALFSPLERAQLGQYMYITDLNKVYTYRITYKKIVDPKSVWLIDDVKGAKLLTLITCADGGVNRWCLQGNLINEQSATKENLAVFN
ncbi:class A sortase [Agrilactobacillus fermenti]|uniref:class A sortase n=1 Tax=Agrilactobacillus fermenti TaxID=2586909 RepID=UPI001E448A37|nr:class A sortase [Agrilactobacillus fermenti]MCD2257360.1 class A sortase [Agrilactobacillus fermenti]